jgi:hypothetical protein
MNCRAIKACHAIGWVVSEDFPNGPDGDCCCSPAYRDAYKQVIEAQTALTENGGCEMEQEKSQLRTRITELEAERDIYLKALEEIVNRDYSKHVSWVEDAQFCIDIAQTAIKEG